MGTYDFLLNLFAEDDAKEEESGIKKYLTGLFSDDEEAPTPPEPDVPTTPAPEMIRPDESPFLNAWREGAAEIKRVSGIGEQKRQAEEEARQQEAFQQSYGYPLADQLTAYQLGESSIQPTPMPPSAESETVESNPWVDPVMAFGGAFGAGGKIAYTAASKAGMTLGGKLSAAAISGVANAAIDVLVEPALGTAMQEIADNPEIPGVVKFPLNMMMAAWTGAKTGKAADEIVNWASKEILKHGPANGRKWLKIIQKQADDYNKAQKILMDQRQKMLDAEAETASKTFRPDEGKIFVPDEEIPGLTEEGLTDLQKRLKGAEPDYYTEEGIAVYKGGLPDESVPNQSVLAPSERIPDLPEDVAPPRKGMTELPPPEGPQLPPTGPRGDAGAIFPKKNEAVQNHVRFEEDPDPWWRNTGQKVKDKLNHLYYRHIDKWHPGVRLMKAFGLDPQTTPAAQNFMVKAQNFSGVVSKITNAITEGVPRWNILQKGDISAVEHGGIRANKGLQPILQKVGEGRYRDFSEYLSRVSSKDRLERGHKFPWSMEEADATIQELAAKNPDFEELASGVFNFADDVLKYARDGGLISKKAYDAMRKVNPFYLPLQRFMGADDLAARIGSSKKFSEVSDTLKRAKGGGEQDVWDPVQNLIEYTYRLMEATDRNDVGRQFTMLAKYDEFGDVFERVPRSVGMRKYEIKDIVNQMREQGLDIPQKDMESLAVIFKPKTQTPDDVVSVIHKGDEYWYRVKDKDALEMIKGMDPKQSGVAVKLLSKPTMLMRAGAVLDPAFLVKNIVRDALTASIYSKSGFAPVVDTIRGLSSVLKNDDYYKAWKASGGEHAAWVSMDRKNLLKQAQDLVATGRMKGKFLNPTEWPEVLRMFSEAGEAATRVGEFRKALQGGADLMTAANRSRDVTLDFSRYGAASGMKEWNRVVAFFNAQVQGWDKMGRAMMDPGKAGKAMKTVGLLTLPSIALYLQNRSDPEYKQMHPAEKALFWNIKVNDQWYKIPKPFELGMIFASMPERFLEQVDMEHPEALDALATQMGIDKYTPVPEGQEYNPVAEGAKEIAMRTIPGVIPTAAVPIIEWFANRSFWTGGDIVPRGRENVDPALQYRNNTTEIAKKVGEFINLPPAQLENVYRGYTASLGMNILNIADSLIYGTQDATGDRSIEASFERLKSTPLADIPLVKSFVVRYPRIGTRATQQFLDSVTDISQAISTSKKGAADVYDPELAGAGVYPPEVLEQLQAKATEASRRPFEKRGVPDELAGQAMLGWNENMGRAVYGKWGYNQAMAENAFKAVKDRHTAIETYMESIRAFEALPDSVLSPEMKREATDKMMIMINETAMEGNRILYNIFKNQEEQHPFRNRELMENVFGL